MLIVKSTLEYKKTIDRK